MRLTVVFLVVLAVACRPATPTPADLRAKPVTAAEIRADIAWLADDAREGRGTGTAGYDSAAAWVARRYVAWGIAPAPGMSGYLQSFTARAVHARGQEAQALPTENVVAYIPGTDPLLANQFIVLGAHLDHLGRSATNALDPNAGDAIRNGADDNASGSVAILELARRLANHPTRRSILIVHFSGEELGLLGSAYFADHSPVPLTSVQAMLNFDMVGRLKNDRLIVYGTGTAAEMPGIVDSAAAGSGLTVNKVPDGVGPSDHSSFHLKDVPVLHFFTDIHDDYHRATDDVERINADGLLQVVDIAERAARLLGDRQAKLPVTRALASTQTTSRQSSGVYLGTIPDMGAADVPGMRISGVREGSPGDIGGLKAGDIIVEFGGHKVGDIYEYTDAMNAFKPGDTVTVIVLRGTERVTLTVTLGRRGG